METNVCQDALVTGNRNIIALSYMTLVVHFKAEKGKYVLQIGTNLKECNRSVETETGHQVPKVPVQKPQGDYDAADKSRKTNNHIEEIKEGGAPVRGMRIASSATMVAFLVIPCIVIRRMVENLAAQQATEDEA